MKEDILEQIVDDYLQNKGFFTRRNIKFRPSASHAEFIKNQDSNHSDIDVIGFNPHHTGVDRVWVVSCKSWQGGFRPASKIAELEQGKRRSGREVWKAFRELKQPKWTEAFFDAVEACTGTREFTYVTAVTRINGDKSSWETCDAFNRAMRGNPIKLLCIADMVSELIPSLNTTVAPSDLTRTLQLLKASGCSIQTPATLRSVQ
ncbi:MAG: hypothetical protein ACK4UN_09975 [Limisphaerales bacterium]